MYYHILFIKSFNWIHFAKWIFIFHLHSEQETQYCLLDFTIAIANDVDVDVGSAKRKTFSAKPLINSLIDHEWMKQMINKHKLHFLLYLMRLSPLKYENAVQARCVNIEQQQFIVKLIYSFHYIKFKMYIRNISALSIEKGWGK